MVLADLLSRPEAGLRTVRPMYQMWLYGAATGAVEVSSVRTPACDGAATHLCRQRASRYASPSISSGVHLREGAASASNSGRRPALAQAGLASRERLQRVVSSAEPGGHASKRRTCAIS